MPELPYRVQCKCGNKLDAAIGVDNDHKPTPGSCSICAYCGQLYRIGTDTLEPITEQQLAHCQLSAPQIEVMLRLRRFITADAPTDDIQAN